MSMRNSYNLKDLIETVEAIMENRVSDNLVKI